MQCSIENCFLQRKGSFHATFATPRRQVLLVAALALPCAAATLGAGCLPIWFYRPQPGDRGPGGTWLTSAGFLVLSGGVVGFFLLCFV